MTVKEAIKMLSNIDDKEMMLMIDCPYFFAARAINWKLLPRRLYYPAQRRTNDRSQSAL